MYKNPGEDHQKLSALASFSLSLVVVFSSAPHLAAQKPKQPQPTPPLLTRTIPRHESFRFSSGGTVTIVGPPAGSITVEGWQRNEVDVTAEIELQAASAADLDRLAAVNTFVADQDTNHIRILTTGTHDRTLMKRIGKNLPKALMAIPWKIDYHIKVPPLTDLDITAGNGPLTLAGVEGAIQINAVTSKADLSLTGGVVSAIVQSGTVNVTVPTRGWHGLGAEIRLASGELNINLAPGFSGNINGEILRNGEIKNTFPNLEPVERNSISSHSLRARAGSGGATLTFVLGEGTMQIQQANAVP